MAAVKRKTYRLDKDEADQLRILDRSRQPVEGRAWEFWKAVAGDRGLDYQTIIGLPDKETFTALPLGHGKHWCYPLPLKCAKPPIEFNFANAG